MSTLRVIFPRLNAQKIPEKRLLSYDRTQLSLRLLWCGLLATGWLLCDSLLCYWSLGGILGDTAALSLAENSRLIDNGGSLWYLDASMEWR